MPYTTHLQQVLAYLKQGNRLQPPAGAALPEAAPVNPLAVIANQGAQLRGNLPAGPPPPAGPR